MWYTVQSSGDVTRTMRGQPNCKRFSSNYRDEMVENVVKSHFKIFCFQKTFHSTNVFCTPSRLFVRLGFRLLVARLTVHPSTVHSVLRQRTRVQYMDAYECVIFLCLFLCHLVRKPTTWNYHILRFRENVKYDGHFSFFIDAVVHIRFQTQTN